MTEDEIRAIVREEIAKAAPVIMAHTITAISNNMKQGGFGYRSYAMQGDKIVDVTFSPKG